MNRQKPILTNMIERYTQNTNGRDYVVGDIHGNFEKLYRELDTFFDPNRDRLFSVGDLVDRGPDNAQVLELLDRDWFYAVRGNHEELILDAYRDDLQVPISVMNGGGWFQEISQEEQDAIAHRFMSLPYAIQVATAEGNVGIVHADIPVNTWAGFVEMLTNPGTRTNTIMYCTWSRDRIRGAVNFPIQDLRALYVGHTPVDEYGLVLDTNIHYLDTGSWHPSRNTQTFQFIQL